MAERAEIEAARAGAQCRAAGMDDVLIKPAELGKLKALVEKWLPGAAPALALTCVFDSAARRGYT